MALVYPCKHPLILAKLAALRSKETRPPEFRRLVRALAALVTYEAAADLPTKDITVTTPLGPAPGKAIADPVLIVPILRAGLGMADGVLDLIPDAEVWHIGLKRDEKTLLPDEYYRKLPDHAREATVFIVDPMLATGGSAVHACELINKVQPPLIKVLALIAAPEGIERLTSAMPDVSVHIGVIDERLNERGFIHPGLGDAGDRLFATFER
ncbi:MAG TPA: uracil phosphoribosyltransferase [Isosphaeraceae bacterium]